MIATHIGFPGAGAQALSLDSYAPAPPDPEDLAWETAGMVGGPFAAVVGRDLRLALRQRGDALTVVLFFVLTAALFPFGLGPEPNLLARIAPGIVWVTALLAVLLSLERLFLADYEGRQPGIAGPGAAAAGGRGAGQGAGALADHRPAAAGRRAR